MNYMMPLVMLMSQTTDPTLSRPRVLVIENDADARQRLQGALERDYRLQSVGSSLEALELLRQEAFDLVLVDVVLPDMAEMELLNRIRTISLTADVPVMLISPRTADQAVLQGLQHGARDYITRPFDMEVVRVRIKSQLALKRRLDEQQQTIALLKTRDEIKDRFLRIATHDLKNPLNSILLAQYHLRTVVGDDPNAAEALDTIEDTVHSMSDLVEDYLDSAELETGYPELKLEAIDVEDVISEVVLRYGVMANRKNIAIILGEAAGRVLADHDRLVQILNNLISNAIKFSTPESSVTIRAETRGRMVRIQVVDHGPGIPQEERASLFKPFSKLSPRPTGGESSSGLGLWIVKELATLQNGAVGMECPSEGGSVFWIELPAPAA
jgi:two-component system, sensor histidine kinase and response regulator